MIPSRGGKICTVVMVVNVGGELTSPETPGNNGFSPRPTPRLIASYKLPKGGAALAISKGLDRDRAVDESGNQIAVFGRVGAGPLKLEETQRMYLRPNGQLWTVSDNPFDPMYRRPGAPSEQRNEELPGPPPRQALAPRRAN